MIRPVDILLVEDNPADADLASELLGGRGLDVRVRVASDGTDALAYLTGGPPYGSSGRADLILLDLNLPKMDGRTLLGRLKGDPALRRIPVVILTSSDAERDVVACYEIGANCYVLKPVGLAEYEAAVRSIEGFWLLRAQLP